MNEKIAKQLEDKINAACFSIITTAQEALDSGNYILGRRHIIIELRSVDAEALTSFARARIERRIWADLTEMFDAEIDFVTDAISEPARAWLNVTTDLKEKED